MNLLDFHFQAPHPFYKPNNDLVICKDPLCASLHTGDYTCETPQQCDYDVEYADGGSSLGVLLNDVFSLNLTNAVKIRPHLAIGSVSCIIITLLFGICAIHNT